MMPHAIFCISRTSSWLGRIRYSLLGVGGGIGEMDLRIALDIIGVLPTWRVLNLPISLMMIIASAISRASVSLRSWCGASGAGDVGWYWGDELRSP